MEQQRPIILPPEAAERYREKCARNQVPLEEHPKGMIGRFITTDWMVGGSEARRNTEAEMALADHGSVYVPPPADDNPESQMGMWYGSVVGMIAAAVLVGVLTAGGAPLLLAGAILGGAFLGGVVGASISGPSGRAKMETRYQLALETEREYSNSQEYQREKQPEKERAATPAQEYEKAASPEKASGQAPAQQDASPGPNRRNDWVESYQNEEKERFQRVR